jgi:hypothetical protein
MCGLYSRVDEWQLRLFAASSWRIFQLEKAWHLTAFYGSFFNLPITEHSPRDKAGDTFDEL